MKNTKRFMALLLTLVLVFGSMSSAFAAVNEDVVDTDYEVAVTKLNAVGIMEGYPDGTFRPEGQITRAEFAKIAVLALGLNDAAEVSKSDTIFTDVDAFHWAAGYINVAVDRGILKGYPDGTYKPSAPLSNAEATTVLTRLVGLGPVVDKEGNWPANYITRANIIGILDDVVVSSTANASRGNAAKMLVNTLEVNKWGATGYGDDGSVDYGELWKNEEDENGDEKRVAVTLLNDNLDIKQYSDVQVSGYDSEDSEVTTTYGTFEVVNSDVVDIYHLYLNEADLWVNDDDEIIFAEVTSDFYLDGVEFDGSDLTLVTADRDIEIDEYAEIHLNGESADKYFDSSSDYDDGIGDSDYDGKTFALGKVVLNNKNDVVYVDLYTFDDIFVAKDLDEDNDDIVLSIDEDEFDLEDYTIFKEGKLITTTDLEEGDVVFFNTEEEFAEVFNSTVSGEIEHVYSTAIEVDDEEYEYDGVQAIDTQVSYYIDEDGDFEIFNNDDSNDNPAEAMEDEGDVTIFLDRTGEMVYITGKLGEVETNTVAGLLIEPIEENLDYFGENQYRFVFVNELGAKITETINIGDLDEIRVDDVVVNDDLKDLDNLLIEIGGTRDESGDIVEGSARNNVGDIVEFIYDEDGDVVELNFFDNDVELGVDDVESDDSYVDGKKLSSSVVVFSYSEDTVGADIDDDDVTVVEWDEENFDEIDNADYYHDGSDVLYVFALDGIVDDTSDVVGVYGGEHREYDGDIVKMTAWTVDGETTYRVDDIKSTSATTSEGAIYILEVNDDTNVVEKIDLASAAAPADMLLAEVGSVITDEDDIDVPSREITVNGTTYKLVSEYNVIDATTKDDLDDMDLRGLRDELEDNDLTITLVLDEADSKYVQLIVITDSDKK
jgi:hypothetical protein